MLPFSDLSDPVDPREAILEKWGVEPGQVWEIPSARGNGAHRIMCGDCISRDDVRALFGGAPVSVDAILTDPPYCSGGLQEAGKRSGSIGTFGEAWGGVSLERDNLSTSGYLVLIAMALSHVSAQRLYMFTDWRMWEWTKQAVEAGGYPARQMLVWDKGSAGMGNDYKSQAELCLYARIGPGQLQGSKASVMSFPRSGNTSHPTEKPVPLLRELMQLGEPSTIYDPLVGSGSTLIAAEMEGRTSYGMEVSPSYVAACLERFSRLGLSPVRVEL